MFRVSSRDLFKRFLLRQVSLELIIGFYIQLSGCILYIDLCLPSYLFVCIQYLAIYLFRNLLKYLVVDLLVIGNKCSIILQTQIPYMNKH